MELQDLNRCDKCNAQAFVKFIKVDANLQLDFCGHHTNKYINILETQGWNVAIDDREILTRRAIGVEVG